MLGFWLSGSQKGEGGEIMKGSGKIKGTRLHCLPDRSGGTLEPRSLFSKMESEVGDVLVYNFP